MATYKKTVSIDEAETASLVRGDGFNGPGAINGVVGGGTHTGGKHRRASTLTEDGINPDDKKRTLGAFAVAIVSFAAVAGGPYGIEAAIGAAGALPVLLGSCILAVLWSATQALMTAELRCVATQCLYLLCGRHSLVERLPNCLSGLHLSTTSST
jgi:hypothetical protein